MAPGIRIEFPVGDPPPWRRRSDLVYWDAPDPLPLRAMPDDAYADGWPDPEAWRIREEALVWGE